MPRPIRPGGEEDLGPIRLEKDVPVTGVVKDEEGHPIAGASIVVGPVGHVVNTDTEGKFTLRGFGPNPKFQMNVRKDGYAHLVGIGDRHRGRLPLPHLTRRHAARGPDQGTGRDPETRRPTGWIEGQAVDADTGKPVRLDKVVLFNFERKPGRRDRPARRRGVDFEQPEPGRFRTSFPNPDEFRLTFSAAGYQDAEVYTPRVTELKTIGGIVARMKKAEGATPAIAAADDHRHRDARRPAGQGRLGRPLASDAAE